MSEICSKMHFNSVELKSSQEISKVYFHIFILHKCILFYFSIFLFGCLLQIACVESTNSPNMQHQGRGSHGFVFISKTVLIFNIIFCFIMNLIFFIYMLEGVVPHVCSCLILVAKVVFAVVHRFKCNICSTCLPETRM